MRHLKRLSTLGLRLLPALALITVILAMASAACNPKPGQTGGDGLGAPRILKCGTAAVSDHATDALPGVNRCLAGDGDVLGCFLGLVQPAVGIVLETVACVTKHEGSAARAVSQADPGNAIEAHRAQRAREFLEKLAERGYAVEN